MGETQVELLMHLKNGDVEWVRERREGVNSVNYFSKGIQLIQRVRLANDRIFKHAACVRHSRERGNLSGETNQHRGWHLKIKQKTTMINDKLSRKQFCCNCQTEPNPMHL